MPEFEIYYYGENAMFAKHDSSGYNEALPGIQMKTLCYGEKTLMTEFLLKANCKLPFHKHPYEQTGYLVSGNIRLTISGEKQNILPGDSWCIPENAEHGAEIIEDSIALEIFSPVRKDYLPKIGD